MEHKIILDKNFWDSKYSTHSTGWDVGTVTTPIKTYIDQLTNKELKIIIPGAGNGHEAEYLFRQGFKKTFVVDISSYPLENLKKRCPDFPDDQLIQSDFYDFTGKDFDLAIEQTFFCTFYPETREKYAKKMNDILKPNGKIAGLLFGVPLNDHQPPFGGKKEDYLKVFESYFEIQTMEPAYNSIPPRKGSELFIILKKKK